MMEDVTNDVTAFASEATWRLNDVCNELKAKTSTPAAPQAPVADDSAFVAANTPPELPKKLLFGWPEILDALTLTNDDTSRNRVSRLNDAHSGPIIVGSQGKQPMVDADKLIPWWNNLERLHAESVQHTTDKAATVAESYQHGKEGEVVPAIAGHVQERRGKR